jgi:hypothetical protein
MTLEELNETLIQQLESKQPVTVQFRKADGSIRTMECVLKDGKVSPKVITVWDLAKDAYRNIPRSRIMAVTKYVD